MFEKLYVNSIRRIDDNDIPWNRLKYELYSNPSHETTRKLILRTKNWEVEIYVRNEFDVFDKGDKMSALLVDDIQRLLQNGSKHIRACFIVPRYYIVWPVFGRSCIIRTSERYDELTDCDVFALEKNDYPLYCCISNGRIFVLGNWYTLATLDKVTEILTKEPAVAILSPRLMPEGVFEPEPNTLEYELAKLGGGLLFRLLADTHSEIVVVERVAHFEKQPNEDVIREIIVDFEDKLPFNAYVVTSRSKLVYKFNTMPDMFKSKSCFKDTLASFVLTQRPLYKFTIGPYTILVKHGDKFIDIIAYDTERYMLFRKCKYHYSNDKFICANDNAAYIFTNTGLTINRAFTKDDFEQLVQEPLSHNCSTTQQ